MTLWLLLALMTAAAVLAVLWPLGRRNAGSRGGSDIAVYRDQLDEGERDRAAGLIGEAEGGAAGGEVSRRLLASNDGTELQPAAPGTWRRRTAALIGLVLL